MSPNNFFHLTGDGGSDTTTLPGEAVSLARIHSLLKETALRLKLDIAFLSRIIENQYYVIGSFVPFGHIRPGTAYPLSGKFIEAMIKYEKMFTYIHQREGPNLEAHPVCMTMHIETFIGSPVIDDGEFLGTICFASERKKKMEFSPFDLALVRDVARNPEVVLFLRQVKLAE